MAGVKILAIEGDKDYQNMLRNILENNGYTVDIVDKGEEALKMLKKNSYSLVILNVELPDINGYALCKTIRTDKSTASIPLIITSEKSTQEDFDKHRKLKVRADDYLLKPYTDDQILRKVENLTGLKIKEEELLAIQEKFEQVLNEKIELERMVKDYESVKVSLEEKIRELDSKLKNLEGEVAELTARNREKDLKIKNLEKELKDEKERFKREIELIIENLKRLIY